MNRCPPIDELEHALADEAAHPFVIAHLGQCAKCRARSKRIRENNSLLRGLSATDSRRLTNALSPAVSIPAPHPVQIDGYENLEEMTRGGQGVVYKARQMATRRVVALKMLLHGAFATPRQRYRFEREIELAAGLRHPNIVTIYESGTTADGRHYCAMELVEGVALDEYMQAVRRKGALPAAGETAASLPPNAVKPILRLFVRICEAVNYAHQRGIIHRDLKPSNILVDAAGEPHVLDFGLAKAIGADLPGTIATTRTGEFMGTFAYAAPEQLRGDPEQIDTRTDVYSLGVMLYQALTGNYPYDVSGSLSAVLRNITETPPAPPRGFAPQVDDEVSTIVLKALGKERERRYQSAGAMAQDIGKYLSGEPIEAKRDSRWYVLKKTARRYRIPLAVSAAFFVLIGAFAVATAIQAQRVTRERDKALAADRATQQHAQRVAAALSESNIERGRAMGFAGNVSLAEDLLWQEFLYPRSVGPFDPSAFNRPDLASPHAYWALWELYAAQPCRAAFLATPGGVPALAFSPDGRTLVSAAINGSLRFWDMTQPLPAAIRNETGPRWGPLLFSSDGAWVLGGGADGTVHLFDAKREGAARVLKLIDGPVLSIAVTPDMKTLVACTMNPSIALWDIASGRQLGASATGEKNENVIALSPDGQRIACGTSDGRLLLWSVDPFRQLAGVNAHSAIVTRVAFSPDGSLIVSASRDNSLRTWTSDSLTAVRTFVGHTAFVNSVCFDPSGTLLASGANDKTIMLWDAGTGSALETYAGHTDRVTTVRFSPDGRTLASCGLDGMVRLWEVHPRSALSRRCIHSDSVFAVAWSPDQKTVATGGADRAIWLWDPQTGSLQATLAGHTDVIFAAAYSPDGRFIASAAADGTARIWDATTHECLRILDCQGVVNWVAFSPDGRTLATCTDMRPTRIWDVASGECRRSFEGRAKVRVPAVAFSPDGGSLAVCDQERDITLWDIASSQRRATLAGHGGQVRTLRYSPDGKLLASAGDDWTIRLWDPATGHAAGALEGHKHDVFAISFSADGRLLASGSRGGNIKLWDPRTRRCLATLDSPADMTFGTALRPDGLMVAWAGKRTSVGIWDLEYYHRHIAGSLEYQYSRLRGSNGDSPVIAAMRAWAAEVMARPAARWAGGEGDCKDLAGQAKSKDGWARDGAIVGH